MFPHEGRWRQFHCRAIGEQDRQAVRGHREHPTRPAGCEIAAEGTTDMEEHETRRKIIRQWMALPKDKRQTEKQVAAFAEKMAQENEFQHSRRDPYQKVMAWLLPRAGRP